MKRNILKNKRTTEAIEVEKIYAKSARKKTLFTLGLLTATIAFAIAATTIGAASLGVGESLGAVLSKFFSIKGISHFAQVVVLQLRLPRIVMAIITGISLGIAGAVMQGVLRNPLVSPYTLGLSSGAN